MGDGLGGERGVGRDVRRISPGRWLVGLFSGGGGRGVLRGSGRGHGAFWPGGGERLMGKGNGGAGRGGGGGRRCGLGGRGRTWLFGGG